MLTYKCKTHSPSDNRTPMLYHLDEIPTANLLTFRRLSSGNQQAPRACNVACGVLSQLEYGATPEAAPQLECASTVYASAYQKAPCSNNSLYKCGHYLGPTSNLHHSHPLAANIFVHSHCVVCTPNLESEQMFSHPTCCSLPSTQLVWALLPLLLLDHSCLPSYPSHHRLTCHLCSYVHCAGSR